MMGLFDFKVIFSLYATYWGTQKLFTYGYFIILIFSFVILYSNLTISYNDYKNIFLYVFSINFFIGLIISYIYINSLRKILSMNEIKEGSFFDGYSYSDGIRNPLCNLYN